MAPFDSPPPRPQGVDTERLKAIIGRLESVANKRVGLRQSIEKRWIEDLQQYWGQYDVETQKALNAGEKSKLFMNVTAPKTDAMAARLMDLLFPTDDKNWGIQPTPVPTLTASAKRAADAAMDLAKKAKAAQEQAVLANGEVDQEKFVEAKKLGDEAKAAATKADQMRRVMDEAKARCDLMASEIDDQLKESLYHAAMRDVIESACRLGTGVAKGPVTGDTIRKGWKPKEGGGFGLSMANGTQPAMRSVDIWGFFPDMDASVIGHSEGVYERHLMNKKRLRKLAALPGFNQEAIRTLLRSKPATSAPAYLADLRNLTGENEQVSGDLFHVWEYSGPLEADDMRDIAAAVGDDQTAVDLQEADPLKELNAIVWFCQGEVLKFAIYPYDSGECLYSVFCLKKDESSIFGYGIPSIIRDPQKSLNAGWRAMLDNAGLGTGPQIVIAQSKISPADGDWVLKPRKIWLAQDGIPNDKRAFETFDIPMHQAELANIIGLSQRFVDEMASMPAIAQGEQGVGITKTAQGMSLLMNSANVTFRRIVKNFDDDMTTPNIRRFYDWNMQFSKKEEIKGDYNVDARGSSVLLVREMQAQNLMVIAIQLGAHPVYGPMLKNRGVLRKLFQAHMIAADDVMLSDEEIDAIMASAQAQSGQMEAEQGRAEYEMAKIEFQREDLSAKVEMANADNATKRYIAEKNYDAAMFALAEKLNMGADELAAKLTDRREERASKERSMAVETAMAKQTGQHAGGAI